MEINSVHKYSFNNNPTITIQNQKDSKEQRKIEKQNNKAKKKNLTK